MALHTRTDRNQPLPRDAIELDQEDAANYMRKIIYSWKKTNEVFFLKYSGGILSGMTALTAVYVNNYYRSRMRLRQYGRISTYLPVVLVPSLASLALQTKFVQSPLIIQKLTCPVCLEIRSALFQALTGCIYPMLLAPVVNFMIASRYYTYNLPHVAQDPKGLSQVYVKVSKPIMGTFMTLIAINCVIASALSYLQQRELREMSRKLIEAEKEWEHRRE